MLRTEALRSTPSVRDAPSSARPQAAPVIPAAVGAHRGGDGRRIAVSLGVAWWKRRVFSEAMTALGHGGRLSSDPAAAVRQARRLHGAVGVWAAREPAGLASHAAAAGVPVVRVEDGFLRSVGLGADFTRAASLILDRTGVYYDPGAPSDLETLLERAPMDAGLLARAAALRGEITRRGLTKYNLGSQAAFPPPPPGRRVVLVPGQVEDDRSVQRGGAGVRGNLDLLRRAREAEPAAFLVYKPHPDVEAGHRRGAVADVEALRFADRVERAAAMPALLAAADAVHVLTSLAGFEALLRGVEVVTHGQPFYSGWGLTRDLAPPVPRRTRRLSLDMLTAGTLILYPVYLDPRTGACCSPEVLIERLAEPAHWRASPLVRLRRWEGRILRRLRGAGA